MYGGAVIMEESKEPEYAVEFSYINKKYNLKKGKAIFLRCLPEPKVIFDDYTEYFVERFEFDDEVIKNIKLQIGKTVCDYLFSKR